MSTLIAETQTKQHSRVIELNKLKIQNVNDWYNRKISVDLFRERQAQYQDEINTIYNTVLQEVKCQP